MFPAARYQSVSVENGLVGDATTETSWLLLSEMLHVCCCGVGGVWCCVGAGLGSWQAQGHTRGVGGWRTRSARVQTQRLTEMGLRMGEEAFRDVMAQLLWATATEGMIPKLRSVEELRERLEKVAAQTAAKTYYDTLTDYPQKGIVKKIFESVGLDTTFLKVNELKRKQLPLHRDFDVSAAAMAMTQMRGGQGGGDGNEDGLGQFPTFLPPPPTFLPPPPPAQPSAHGSSEDAAHASTSSVPVSMTMQI